MNKVHHIVWNKTLSVWQAASENTKSNTKNGKAFRLNTLTSVLALSFLGWFFPQIASAGCDIPAVPASNSVVTCTGTTSGTYTIRNVQNVQLTNEGAWNLSGASFGMVSADTGNLTGLVVSNEGTMTWDDARYGGTGTGARAALNVYTKGNTATKATTINGSTGTINLNILTSSGADRYLYGMALSAQGSDSRAFWTNDGQINVESAVDYHGAYVGAYVGAGAVRGTTQVEVVNTGNVNVNQPSGTSPVVGILGLLRGGSTIPASAIVTNSGNIRVVSPNARFSKGLWLGQIAANLNNNVSVLKLNNTGTIQLDTGPAKGAVVYLEPSSLTNIFFDILN